MLLLFSRTRMVLWPCLRSLIGLEARSLRLAVLEGFIVGFLISDVGILIGGFSERTESGSSAGREALSGREGISGCFRSCTESFVSVPSWGF